MTAACNFISLGEKLCELLDKNVKGKEGNYEICALCRSVSRMN